MKRNIIIVATLCLTIFIGYVFVASKPSYPEKEMLNLINTHEFNQLDVSWVGQDNILLSIHDKKAVRQFTALIDIDDDVGVVMSPGTYRFILYENNQPTVHFQLVSKEFLRYEGGSDFELTKQSSKAILMWLKEHIAKSLRNTNDGSNTDPHN